MNLILFKETELTGTLSLADERARHIKKIIGAAPGDTLDIGILGGKKGKALIKEINEDVILFDYELTKSPPPLYPVTLIIGTPRPPVAQRLLKDLTTGGVKRIFMINTDLGEKSYLNSNLWKNDKFYSYLEQGASQAESTLIPEVRRFYSLKKAMEAVTWEADKLALDNISPDFPFSGYLAKAEETVVAIGAERGWTDRERELMREADYRVCSLGERVIRTETACHMAMTLVLGARKLI